MSRWLKIAGVALIVMVLIAGGLAGWMYRTVLQSLPLVDGEAEVAGLSSAVSIERDVLGVPTIRGEDRLDISRALGFLHAQERFFQMDLLRRRAVGSRAAAVGGVLGRGECGP